MNLSRLLHPRYADVAATLALIFAMSGTAYAVATVHTSDIVDGAVTTPKLHAGAVAASKLGAGSVITGKLADGSVITGKLADGSVVTVKLADGSVTTGKLVDGSVITGKLADDSVTNSKLGAGSVTNSKLGAGSVTNSKLGAGSVTNSKLGLNSVIGSNVSPNSLTLGDIAGINVSGAISFTLAGNACGQLNLGVSGATAGQAAVLTWTGAVPTHIVLGPLKVVDSTHIIAWACNESATSFNGTGIGVRIVTFG